MNFLPIVAHLLLLATLSRTPAILASNFDSFPDIFQLMLDKDRYRIQYELSVYGTGNNNNDTSTIRSALIDETYSFGAQSGRLLVDRGANLKTLDAFDIFFWFITGAPYQDSYWLRPFVCLSTRLDIDQKPVLFHSLNGLLPNDLNELLIYHRGHRFGASLQGLGAILANVIRHNEAELKPIERQLPSEDTKAEESNQIWSFEHSSGHLIEFTLPKKDLDQEELSFASLQSLQMYIRQAGSVEIIGQLTVLKVEHDFSLDLLRLPTGYSCSVPASTDGKTSHSPTSLPLVRANRIKYTYLVSVAKEELKPAPGGTEDGAHADLDWRFDRLDVPEPIDSMRRPSYSSSSLVLLYDEPEFHLATQSRKRAEFGAPPSASTTVWDLASARKFVLDEDTCQGPISFKSSIDLSASRKYKSFVCSDEGVQVELGDSRISIRLNEVGLKWLLFTLQNQFNENQLRDRGQVDEQGVQELTYEMPARDLLCLFDSQNRQINSSRVLILSKFLNDQRTNKRTPKSSSIMLFNSQGTKLDLLIQLDILHMEPYRPWASSRHLVDLSGCMRAQRLKKSAILRFEYPLDGWQYTLLRHLPKAHERIRSELFAHLKLTYDLPLARVPSIEVKIAKNELQIEMNLLDEWRPLDEAQKLPVKSDWEPEQFSSLLKRATRSVLLASENSCADYCRQYLCKLYIYCRGQLSCYIYTEINGNSSSSFGSFRGPKLNCDAHEVALNSWDLMRDYAVSSRPLEEVLHSITESIEARDQFDRAGESGPRPSIEMLVKDEQDNSQLLRLEPSFVYYSYDYPDNQLQSNTGTKFDLGNRDALDVNANFQILLSGFGFTDSSPVRTIHDIATDADLETNGLGFAFMEDLQLIDCTSACLRDPNCHLYSHCVSSNECVLTQLNLSTVMKMLHPDDSASSMDNNENRLSVGGLALVEAPDCAIMKRTYLDQFEQLEVRMINSFASHPLDDVVAIFQSSSVEECAERCTGNPGDEVGCLSFDFCSSLSGLREARSACVLFKQRLVSKSSHVHQVKGDQPTTEVKPQVEADSSEHQDLLGELKHQWGLGIQTHCTHYVRNYLADFHKRPARGLAEGLVSFKVQNYAAKEMQLDLQDISLVHCAQLCHEEPTCGAFEYCTRRQPEASGGLHLSCSLGNQRTFDLSSLVGRTSIQCNASDSNTLREFIREDKACSLYTYRSLSLILVHKKRSLTRLEGHLEQNGVHENMTKNDYHFILWLDIITLLLSFISGKLLLSSLSQLGATQFAFSKLREAPGVARGPLDMELARSSAANSTLAVDVDVAASSFDSDHFNMEPILKKTE